MIKIYMLYYKEKEVKYYNTISNVSLEKGFILKRLSDGMYYKYMGKITELSHNDESNIYSMFFGFCVNRNYLKKIFESENDKLVVYTEKE